MKEIEENHLILVPCDFTPLSFYAMEHGTFMSKVMKCRMVILHVSSRANEIAAMTKKMNLIAEDFFVKFDVRPDVIVRQGSQPHSVIRAVADELKPSLVILKTYGGSKTLTILSGSSTPFLVIQGEPKNKLMTNIAFPINFLLKHDEKMLRMLHFSEYYPDAVMHIITPSGKGVGKERLVSSNISLMTKVLENQGVKVKFSTHDKEKNTAETILALSKDADMIVAQMEEVSKFTKFFFGIREEKLIHNADKIPVLCFNNEKDLKRNL